MKDSTVQGDAGANDEPKFKQVSDQDTESPEGSSVDFERWPKSDIPSEITQRVNWIQRKSVSYSGPLPPASEVAKYEEVYPGAADRIFTLSENLLKLQSRVSDQYHSRSILKTITSTVVSLSMMALAVFAILYDPAWLSIPLGTAGILSLLLREWFRGTKGRK